MKSVPKNAAWRDVCRTVGLLTLLVAPAIASATDIVAVPPPDKGTLYLETVSGKLQFRWAQVAPNPPQTVVQKIIDKSWITWKPADFCTLVLNPATTAPTATTPGVGLVNMSAGAGFIGDHIGVKGTGLCSEISGAETLTITLGGQLDGYQVYRTELNLEMKSKAVARIDTTFGSLTQTFIIQSPGSTIPATAVIPPGATIVNCAFETAPQEKDICRWTSDAFWSSASIKALTGVVVVEGGSGGGGGKFSQFSITQLKDTLACAPVEGIPVPGLTAEGPNGSIAVGTRLDNTDPTRHASRFPPRSRGAKTQRQNSSSSRPISGSQWRRPLPSSGRTRTCRWAAWRQYRCRPNSSFQMRMCRSTSALARPATKLDPLFGTSIDHVEQFVAYRPDRNYHRPGPGGFARHSVRLHVRSARHLSGSRQVWTQGVHLSARRLGPLNAPNGAHPPRRPLDAEALEGAFRDIERRFVHVAAELHRHITFQQQQHRLFIGQVLLPSGR